MTGHQDRIVPTIYQGDAPALFADEARPALMQQGLDDPLQSYMESLRPASRQAIKKRLRAVAALFSIPNPDTFAWHTLRAREVQRIVNRLQERGASPATVNLTRAVLRGIAVATRNANLMSDEEYRRILEVKPDKGQRLPAGRATSGGELAALVDACDRDPGPAGVRDAAMLAVLYTGGLRRSELAGLALSDYTADPPTVRVLGKGNKEREVPLPQSAGAAVAAWLALRGTEPGGLFLPLSRVGRPLGRSITAQAVNNMLIKRAEQAGVNHLSPHDLRRTFVSTLLDKGADISTVQGLAGHASVTTTQRYDRRGEATKRQAVDLLHFPTSRRGRTPE